MSRNNKLIKTILSNIFNDDMSLDSCKDFLSIDKEFSIKESDTIKFYKQKYRNLVHKTKDDIIELSLIEQLIVQLRCRSTIDQNIKLFFASNNKNTTYVYARTLFYKSDTNIRDIRVFMGDIKTLGVEHVTDLYGDPSFMSICRTKLDDIMTIEIINTRNKLKQFETVSV